MPPSQISFSRFGCFCIVAIGTLIELQLVLSQNALISNVCGRTSFVDYCKHALMSDPTANGADLHRLGQISIGLTVASAQRSLEKADQLISQTKDIVLVGKLKQCRADYATAAVQMRNAGYVWQSGNVGGTRSAGFASVEAVLACKEALGGSEGALAESNRDIEYLSHIVLVIVDFT